MKLFFLFLTISVSFQLFASEDLTALQKKYRGLRHEASKEWDSMKKDCDTKYPNRFKKDHADYDAHFKCNEAVYDATAEFEAKRDAEFCEKFKFSCKKKD